IIDRKELRLLVLSLPEIHRHELDALQQALLRQGDADTSGVGTVEPVVNGHHRDLRDVGLGSGSGHQFVCLSVGR
nr:hypothetical protein [Tanacetum cinerariifolium]